MTLRKNLVYSNGVKVKASDFTYSVERSIKLNWGGSSWFTGTIVGAAAYASGKASTISGITTNDATGQIVIHLLTPTGYFENILAFVPAALVPAGTPIKNLTNDPPPGVGPYMIKDVVPDKSWVGEINPYYAKEVIPGIPQGHVVVDAKVESNTTVETEDVLNNTADLFDTGDTIAPSLLASIKSQASSRYSTVPVVQNLYFFLNVTTKPFNNQLVREAVNYAIDRRVLDRLDDGNLVPDCYFLPTLMVGHPTKPCPYGNPTAAPDLAKAKALIAKSGDKGDAVTVWSEERQPRTEFSTYWASVLTELGFKVTIKPVVDANYFPTIGNLKLEPQTGFADWDEDFPDPADFYLLLTKAGIQPVNNENFSQVDDPYIQAQTAKLDPVPSSKLSTIASQWQALDYYTAQKAYEVVFGYQTWPKFTSNRVNYGALLIQPSYGWDWTSITLK